MAESRDRGPTQDSEAILEELKALVAEFSEGKLTAEAIDPRANQFDCGYVDSLSAVMLLAHIEERWSVYIEDMDLVERFCTLGQIADHIQKSA